MIVMDVPSYISVYTRYPQTLFDGISQVGGIIAASKLLLIVLYFINRYWFEHRLKQTNHDFKDRYSIENFDRMLHQMEKM